jgi:gliding motility-associated-like protein
LFSKQIISLLGVLLISAGISLQGQVIHTVLAGASGIKYGVDETAGSVYEWFVDGGVIADNLNHEIEVDWGLVPGIYDIKALETNIYGCVGDTVYAQVEVTNIFDLDIGGPIIRICENVSHTLDAGTGFVSYIWNDDPGQIGQTFATGTAGTYWVQVVDLNGLIGRDTVEIIVKPLPVVDLGADTVLCINEFIILDAGNPGALYNWSTGAISQTIIFEGINAPDTVSVQVDLDECLASDTIIIDRCEEYSLVIYDAFTPNGDGFNDTWEIRDNDGNPLSVNFPKAIVEVFDRWGQLVFRSAPGYDKPWDGTFRGRPMQMDSYHYVIQLKDGSKDIIGNVTIIR